MALAAPISRPSFTIFLVPLFQFGIVLKLLETFLPFVIFPPIVASANMTWPFLFIAPAFPTLSALTSHPLGSMCTFRITSLVHLLLPICVFKPYLPTSKCSPVVNLKLLTSLVHFLASSNTQLTSTLEHCLSHCQKSKNQRDFHLMQLLGGWGDISKRSYKDSPNNLFERFQLRDKSCVLGATVNLVKLVISAVVQWIMHIRCWCGSRWCASSIWRHNY